MIVNPNAGRQKGRKDWEKIAELFDKHGIKYHAEFTERKDHAVHIAENRVSEGFHKIIVVGGDGTINEVVNGIFRQKKFKTHEVTLGMILVGTGNDWGRMYGIPEKYKKAVKVLKRGKTFLQDAGFVTFYEGEDKKERYFVNMAGMGYDALVAQKTNAMKEKGKGGTLAYLYNLLVGLFQYKQVITEIHVDHEKVFEGAVFSTSIGICKYNGGGMMQLPEAVPDDGLLDVTLFKNLKKKDVVKNIKKLYDGTFLSLPFVKTYRGKEVSFITHPANGIYLETDGESLAHSPLHFSVIPRSVKVIINEKP